MNNKPSSQSGNPAGRESGVASGKHQGLRQPSDDQRTGDKLENADLESRGANMEDHLRDRRGKGVAGDYDDSIDHDADEGYVQEDAAKRLTPDSRH